MSNCEYNKDQDQNNSNFDCKKENCIDNKCNQENRCAIHVKKNDTKAFCMCGLSKNKPFCDGTHEKNEGDCKFPRVEFFKETKNIYICNCGKTKDKPFCDGSCGREKEEIIEDLEENDSDEFKDTQSIKIEMKAGVTKAFCMCGLSNNKPYCDGSHIGTNCEAAVLKYDSDKVIYICSCGKSKNKPFCDKSCLK